MCFSPRKFRTQSARPSGPCCSQRSRPRTCAPYECASLPGSFGHNQLVLLALAVLNGHALGHAHLTNVLLSQEVSDLDERAALRDGAVDGEVSIHSPHLVTESQGDSLEEVLDVRADGP